MTSIRHLGILRKQTITSCNTEIISATRAETHSSGLVGPFHFFIIRHKSHIYLVYHLHLFFLEIQQICFSLIAWKPAPLSDRSLLNYPCGSSQTSHLLKQTNISSSNELHFFHLTCCQLLF